MDFDLTELGRLIHGMRNVYVNGDNAMEYARSATGSEENSSMASLIAYDLQAGTYIQDARVNFARHERWSTQLAGILDKYVTAENTILEVGCGEATTLAGVLKHLRQGPRVAFGFDISWSRCAYGKTWLEENKQNANLFVADLFNIPLDDSSIDVIYTSHSLEPNGGREEEAIAELLRVARGALVLVEPVYELADIKARERMDKHGYVRNLKKVAENLGAAVIDYRMLDYSGNPLNPSGLLLLDKSPGDPTGVSQDVKWRCPLTGTPLVKDKNGYYSVEAGVAYPVFGGIPLLCESNAVVASAFASLVAGSRVYGEE